LHCALRQDSLPYPWVVCRDYQSSSLWSAYPRSAGRRDVITAITHINTKQDLSRWTRAHADVTGITWSVIAGPGGTMIIVEHEEDRSSLDVGNVSLDALLTEASLITEASLTESADTVGAAAAS
jgi:hypothetical protein